MHTTIIRTLEDWETSCGACRRHEPDEYVQITVGNHVTTICKRCAYTLANSLDVRLNQ